MRHKFKIGERVSIYSITPVDPKPKRKYGFIVEYIGKPEFQSGKRYTIRLVGRKEKTTWFDEIDIHHINNKR